MRNRPAERYPLPSAERELLWKNALASECLIFLMGLLGAVLLDGFARGDWSQTLLGFAWVDRFARTFTPSILMLLVPAACVACVMAIQALALRSGTELASSIVRVRQGVTGELCRLSLPQCVGVSFLAGFCEEFLFRYVFISALVMLLLGPLGWAGSAVVAVLVSSVVFTLIHVQYRDPLTIGVVLVVSLVFGALFVFTGSYLVCAVTHMLYDLADILGERWAMVHEEDYFRGKVPTTVMLDMESELRAADEKADDEDGEPRESHADEPSEETNRKDD